MAHHRCVPDLSAFSMLSWADFGASSTSVHAHTLHAERLTTSTVSSPRRHDFPICLHTFSPVAKVSPVTDHILSGSTSEANPDAASIHPLSRWWCLFPPFFSYIPFQQGSCLAGDLVVGAEEGIWGGPPLLPPPASHDHMQLVIPAQYQAASQQGWTLSMRAGVRGPSVAAFRAQGGHNEGSLQGTMRAALGTSSKSSSTLSVHLIQDKLKKLTLSLQLIVSGLKLLVWLFQHQIR